MGVMDFMKEAGEKLAEMGQNAEMAKKIEERIGHFGIGIKGLEVSVDDDTATVKGFPASEEDREKALLVAGNVRGIGRVSDQMRVKGALPKSGKAGHTKTRFHTVQKGDTLSAIAKKFYGSPNDYMKIFKANKPMLDSPDKIYPGQVLRIP
ncbi:MAG: peptidoglycan-binding protein LysM [Candidatus Aegiribacteria sp.]